LESVEKVFAGDYPGGRRGAQLNLPMTAMHAANAIHFEITG
jgi:hypothetical protein